MDFLFSAPTCFDCENEGCMDYFEFGSGFTGFDWFTNTKSDFFKPV